MSSGDRSEITPDMKIADLLEQHPEVETVLLEAAPSLAKLKTPSLRSVVTNTKTVRQIAEAEGISIGVMIGRLRGSESCPEGSGLENDTHSNESRPIWLEEGTEVGSLDAREQIQSGGHPLPTVMSAILKLAPKEVYSLTAPFEPIPLIKKARDAGCVAWTEQLGPEEFKTYFAKAQ